jgi:hypothetical protein
LTAADWGGDESELGETINLLWERVRKKGWLRNEWKLGKAVDQPQSLNHGSFFCPKSYQVIEQTPLTKADRPTQNWIRSVSKGDRF